MSYMISKIVILENPTFLLIMQGLYMSLLSRLRVILSKLQLIIPSPYLTNIRFIDEVDILLLAIYISR